MRRFYRCFWAAVFALAMLGVANLPEGRLLEREYGLPLLYKLRGDVPVPPGALVIGLDDVSVDWLASWAGKPPETAPKMQACIPPRAKGLLREATNINHISRPVFACLVRELVARNAQLIVFDINFNRGKVDDDLLADAIGAAGNVLLFESMTTDENGNPLRHSPLAKFRDRALGTMAFHVDSERGEIVTSYITSWAQTIAEQVHFGDLRAMPDRAWAEYTGRPLPTGQPRLQPIWLYGPPRSVPTVRLRDALDPTVDALPADLSQTAVFIGSSDPEDAEIDDHFLVPTSGRGNLLIGGVELGATAFLNRLHGTMLNRMPGWAEGALVFLVALAGGLSVVLLSGRRLWLTIGVIFAGYLAVAAFVFQIWLLWLPVALPAFLTTLCVALAAISTRYFFARALVSRLAPRQVASILLDGTDAERRATRIEQATIMFTDLRGSTGMAERLDAWDYAEVMNAYYDTATDVVEHHGGMVIEFLGDGIVAMFSESVTGGEHAARGIDAARDMVDRIRALNDQSDTSCTLSIRIGLNSGLTSTGEIGARHRFNFKALGEVVTVASRLEQLGKSLIGNEQHIVLISHSTQQSARLPETVLDALGPQLLRGREAALDVFRLRLK